jgi:hypothetical protein
LDDVLSQAFEFVLMKHPIAPARVVNTKTWSLRLDDAGTVFRGGRTEKHKYGQEEWE